MSLTFDQVLAVTSGRLGTFDAPCPLCAPVHNARKKVLRVWAVEPDFATYNCTRCSTSGWVRDGRGGPPPSPERLEELRRAAAARSAAEAEEQRRKAQYLWRVSVPLCRTPAEIYLREARSYPGAIPATLRFLPPDKPEHHPAMIAAFGVPDEPEPGRLGTLKPDQVGAIHLTLLRPDGSWKADVADAKITVGKSAGLPLVLAPANDGLGLLVTEGIEDALTLHESTGLGAWAAGSAGRLPALADAIPAYLGCITVVVDADPAGQTNASKLASALRRRGLHVEMLNLSSAQEVAA